MKITTYGMEKPETGDAGNVFCPGLERNIDRFIEHTHEGTNSTKILQKSLTKPNTLQAASTSWADAGSDGYSQVIDLTASGFTFDDSVFKCTLSDGRTIEPVIEKINDDSFTMYVNDNSLTINIAVL